MRKIYHVVVTKENNVFPAITHMFHVLNETEDYLVIAPSYDWIKCQAFGEKSIDTAAFIDSHGIFLEKTLMHKPLFTTEEDLQYASMYVDSEYDEASVKQQLMLSFDN